MTEFRELHYRLHILPDLEQLTFEGRLELSATPTAPLDNFRLNAIDLDIRRCTVKKGKTVVETGFVLDATSEILSIQVTPAVSEPFSLCVEYTGEINDRMAGFYRSAYQWNDQKHFMAVTQFQESDARRAMPCFDHPRHKATFDIEMTVDADLTAISNGAVCEVIPLPNGKKQVRFERTPRMSTYLVFFGAGRFKDRQDGEDERLFGEDEVGLVR